MKKFLSIVFIMVSMHVFAQTNPITSINISLPTNPDANTANWGEGTSTLLISAGTQTATGRVDPAVQDSKILVTIKQNGNKVCGAYTASSAPDADFNTVTKVWTGTNAASLLGKGCTLSPGDYELSVQFFGYSNGKTIPLSDEKIKPFTIRGNDQQSYQAPQGISPTDGTVYNDADIKKPITFRWTPVIPKPQGTVTYQLLVWQLMQGQTGPQAIKANSPILTKDVENLTQVVVPNIVDGPCKPPMMCDFVWTVKALNKDGKPLGGANAITVMSFSWGASQTTTVSGKLVLVAPANNARLVNLSPVFKWEADGSDNTYSLRIVEIREKQSPEEALKTNKLFFEKDSLKELSFKYPASAPKFGICKTYAWSIFDRWGNLLAKSPNTFTYGPAIAFSWATDYYVDNTDILNYLHVKELIIKKGVYKFDYSTNPGGNVRLILAKPISAEGIAPEGMTFEGIPANSSCNQDGSECIGGPKSTSKENPTLYTVIPVIENGTVREILCIYSFRRDVDSKGRPSFAVDSKGGPDYAFRRDVDSKGRPSLINPTVINAGSSSPVFKWKADNVQPGQTYSLKIVEIHSNQSPEDAINTNSPFLDKKGIKETSFAYPASAPKLISGKQYAWALAVCTSNAKQIGLSTLSVFTAGGCDVHLDLAVQSVECISTTNGISKYKVCVAATYTGSAYNLTYANTGSGFTAYAPSYTPVYAVSNVTPALQVQNSGASTTVNYCLDVSVPTGQTSMVVGLQGDDKDPGPLTCQAAASVAVRLPQCTTPTCDCGTWGTLTIDGRTYQNGQNFLDWDCGVPVRFSSSYQCSGSNCQAVTSWIIQKDGVTIQTGNSGNNLADNFTPTANGTYTVTINATCGGVRCMPLTFTLHEYNCVKCDCGTWGPLVIPGAAGNTSYKCGTQIPWNCGQPFNFTSTYQCSSANCQATTAWEVVQGGAVLQSGTGTANIAGGFTPTANGTYTINLSAVCGGIKCPICSYTVVIANCLSCDCGTWGPLVIPGTGGRLDKSTITGNTSYKCGSSIPWSCNQPFNFTSTYQCSSANCRAVTSWQVTLGGVVVGSGSGTTNLAGSFTPTANGVYTVTLGAECGGIKCLPCTYTVTVRNCVDCNCGHWAFLLVNRILKYECGSKDIAWKCGQVINFSDTYFCSPTGNNCKATTGYTIAKDGALIETNTGTNAISGSFTPTTNGTYTITLYSDCNGLKCPPCTYTFVVTNCITCDCGSWASLAVPTAAGNSSYKCGSEIPWSCKQPFNFSNNYTCFSPGQAPCRTVTSWQVALNGGVVASGTGTGRMAGGFIPTANGTYTLTLSADCGGIKCPPCTYSIIVTNCVTCDCGSWNPLIVNRETKYKCGSEIPWKCSQPFSFTDIYHCSSTGENCVAKTSWVIKNGDVVIQTGTNANSVAGSFTPTTNGTYTITLSADCGGIKCLPCTYTIVVTGCVTCDCGSWGPLVTPLTAGRLDKSTIMAGNSYKCGSSIPWSCKQPFNFTSTYQCSTSAGQPCRAVTSWQVTLGGAVVGSGSGTANLAGAFTPTANGVYTVTLNAECGGIKCPPCTYSIVVTNCITCDCGHWAFFLVNKRLKYECGSKDIAWKCGQVINFTDNYSCSPTGGNCKAATWYTIAKDGALIETNTGTNIVSGSFTPTTNGTYTFTLYADCNGLKCPPCTYTFVVTDCITCNCGTWTPLTITGAAGNVDYKCGSAIQWRCNQPLNFGAGYECAGGARSCLATISWDIKKDGVTVQSNTTSSNVIHGSFTPTASGTYTITLNAVCNGVQCAPCVYTVVTNCISCNCGSWDPLIVNRETKFECGDKRVIPWKCNQPFNFTDTYHCSSSGENCAAKVSWVIKNGGTVIQTGTNANSVAGSFTPTTNGTYTITLSAVCNDIKCQLCTYTISVTNCVTCNCGSWGLLGVPHGSNKIVIGYKPGATIQAACSQPFNFTDSYQCSSSDKTCLAAITYEVKLNGTVVKTGVGNGSVNGTFTPTDNGTYTITLNATCNGVTCQPCGYNVVVANCCDCGNWNNIVVNGNKGYPCDSHIPWTLNAPFSFRDTYTSNPNGGNCVAVTSWDIKRNGVLITSGTGTGGVVSGSFTPTVDGSTYVLTEHATCNGKTCTVCTMSILIPASPCPVLCNGGFETIKSGAAPTSDNPTVQTDEGNVTCWKTTEADSLIEIWKSGDSYVTAYEGSYFAEISATTRGTLSQSFTTISAKYVVVSFAHRGRYAGPDTMKVSLDHGGVSLALGTFSATDTGWTYHTLPARALAAGTTYTLKFTAISSDGGKGSAAGGNFLDDVSISCVDVLPNTNTTTTTQKMKQLKKPLRSNKVKR